MLPRLLAPFPLVLLAACGGGTDDSAPAGSPAASPGAAAPSAPTAAAAAVSAIDPARLADPCQFKPAEITAALGLAVDSTEPATMGTMLGCSYKGAKGMVRLNLIVHDPVYFAQATAMSRTSRPGEKADVAGDPDKAWWQFQDTGGTILHYYRQNVEVEVIPMFDGSKDRAAMQAGLLKLRRVP